MDMLNTAGVSCESFEFVCVQSSEPYDVIPHTLSDAWVNDGRGEYLKQLARLRSAAINYDGSNDD